MEYIHVLGSSWMLTNLFTTDLFSPHVAGTSLPTITQHTQSDEISPVPHQRCYSRFGQRLGGVIGPTLFIDTEQTPGPGTASVTI